MSLLDSTLTLGFSSEVWSLLACFSVLMSHSFSSCPIRLLMVVAEIARDDCELAESDRKEHGLEEVEDRNDDSRLLLELMSTIESSSVLWPVLVPVFVRSSRGRSFFSLVFVTEVAEVECRPAE